MSNKFLLTGVVLALSLTMAGCQQPMTPAPTAPGLAVVAPGQGSVTATMHLEITDVAGRHLLTAGSEVLPWVKADIDHVKLSLYDGASALVVSTSVSQASLDGLVSFSNLRMNTTYKVVAQAWADAGETQRIDAGLTDESACTTTFTTTNVDRVYVDALNLKLANKTFSGSTLGSAIHVTDGVVENTTATEAVTVVAPAPTLSSLSSTGGPLAGGNTVTLTGTGFTGATVVTFGGMPATSFTVVSPTEISAIVPFRLIGGAVDVVVITPSGSATAAGAYTYADMPLIGYISPASGGTAGGDLLMFGGSGFTGVTAVTFGGTPASSFVAIGPNMLQVMAPAHAAGVVDVVVTNAGGSATAVGAYSYLAAPTITSVSPDNGPEFGGFTATVTGTGFTTATSVTVGGVASSFTVVSDTQLVIVVPAYPSPGSVDVVVTTSSGSTTAAGGFTYVTDIP